MVERAPAPPAASADDIPRGRLRPAPLHPELTTTARIDSPAAARRGSRGGARTRAAYSPGRKAARRPRPLPARSARRLVAEPPVDEGRGDREREVRAVVRGLEQCRPRVRDDEDVPEHPDHHVGEVGGRSPHGEAASRMNGTVRPRQTNLALSCGRSSCGCVCATVSPIRDLPSRLTGSAALARVDAPAPPRRTYFSSNRRRSEGSRSRSSRMMFPSVL